MNSKIPTFSLTCFIIASFLVPRISLGHAARVQGCLLSSGVTPLSIPEDSGAQLVDLDLGNATIIDLSDGSFLLLRLGFNGPFPITNCSISAGRLRIINGGRVIVSATHSLILTGSFNRLEIGNEGNLVSSLEVFSGGFVDAASDPLNCSANSCNNFVSNIAGSTGTLTISGPGSRVDAINGFVVGAAAVYDPAHQGLSSTGTVLVQNGGALNTQDGTVSTGPGGSMPLGTETTLGIVRIEGVASQWNVTGSIQIAVAGPLFPGTATGIVTACNGGEITAGSGVSVFDGGTLGGNGTVNGDVFVNGGTIEPGCSPGTFTVNGNVVFLSGDLVLEVEGAAPGSFDVLAATDFISIESGKAVLSFKGGFAPQTGDTFAYLQSSTVIGADNLAVEIVGLLPGFDFDVGASGEVIARTDGVPAMVEPLLDVRPGDDRDEVNVSSNQIFPVGILTTDSQPIFDASQVNPDTIRFGPAGAQPVPKKVKLKDVDKDGDQDLRVWFRGRQTGLTCGDTQGVLTASTYSGTAVEAIASLNAVCDYGMNKCFMRKSRTAGHKCHRHHRHHRTVPHTVYFNDFDGGLAVAPRVKDVLDGITTTEPVQGYGGVGSFGGDFLRNTTGGDFGTPGPIGTPGELTRLTLTGLRKHNSIDINFLLAIIDSWDGSLPGSPPPDGCDFCHPDIFNVRVDGIVVFDESFGFNGPTFVPPPGVPLTVSPLGFNPDFDDAAYDMGLNPTFDNIPHTARTLTIEWFADGAGWQGGDDESWAIDNLEIILNE